MSAVVTDVYGRQSTATQSLTVLAVNPDVPAPTAALLTPLANRNLLAGTPLTLTFAASVANTTTLARASVYADGVLLAAFDGNGNPISSTGAATNPIGTRPTVRDAAASAGPSGMIFQTSYQSPGWTPWPTWSPRLLTPRARARSRPWRQ